MLAVMGISSYSYCTCKKVQLECIKCCNMLAVLQVVVQILTQILYPCCSFQKSDISKDEAKCVYRYISEFIQAERYFSSFEMSDCCSKKNEYKRSGHCCTAPFLNEQYLIEDPRIHTVQCFAVMHCLHWQNVVECTDYLLPLSAHSSP